MSDDLVKRLRATCNCNIESTPCMVEEECRAALAAADRIEELEAKLSKSEALLAKAVEFAEVVVRCGYGALWDKARTTLAELKGQDDE